MTASLAGDPIAAVAVGANADVADVLAVGVDRRRGQAAAHAGVVAVVVAAAAPAGVLAIGDGVVVAEVGTPGVAAVPVVGIADRGADARAHDAAQDRPVAAVPACGDVGAERG